MLHIPHRLKSFFIKFLLCLLLLTVCRFLFLLFNYSFFSGLGISAFIGGLRFDFSTLGYLLIPLFFLHLLFFIPWQNRVYQGLIKLFFYLPALFIIILNCIDLEYFKFTFKRSSSDLFHLFFLSDDIENQSAQILLGYWYLIFVAAALLWGVSFLYKKTALSAKRSNWKSWIVWSPIFLAFMVISARGGIQLKPLDIIHAGRYTSAQNIPLVLNTPFAFMKSLGKENLHEVNYYADEILDEIYSPIQNFIPDSPSKKLNVAVIILEGFSSEYIGFYNDYKGYTPFLDSLMKKSLVFTNAFSNGKKSIESLPAILSGIPSLSPNPYISSNYSGNKIQSLPMLLEKHGYNTSFYHGGANGTMGFDAFANMAGIDHYYGLSQYPEKQEHYDGNWGIFDEPYLQYLNSELTKKDEPFFTGVFTLSSHHPYTIPEQYENKFPKGTLKIHESIGYADYALKLFFESAKKQDYYDNTLFIIVADHTAQTDQVEYQNLSGMFRIPLIFHLKDELQGVSGMVAQQSDIFPSVIDYLNYPAEFICFGNSLFKEDAEHFAINYFNGLYQYIEDGYSLLFDGEESISLTSISPVHGNDKKKPNTQGNLLNKKPEIAEQMEIKLKAIIQQYNQRVIKNQLTVD